MVTEPGAYQWSSARAHITGQDDALVKVKPLLELVGDWSECLGQGLSQGELETFHRHERIGRPLGSDGFISKIGSILNRDLFPKKAGRKKKLST
ncbi:MAG: hypothetical protein JRI85_17890 [Deltaproteobacteria bacterium]|nr:hypothetical protein [Deltaproteobacteria bacterium]